MAALIAFLSLAFVGAASAHSIWIEREGDGSVRLYFGEFDENLREASPGLLDRLSPQAKVAGSDKALKVDKAAGYFAAGTAGAPGSPGADDSVVAEDVRINERKGDKPARILTKLGARYVGDFKERPPVNTLDVVPAGKSGLFKVFYQGKPLAKAKLELIAESGWKHEFKSDQEGMIEMPVPWRGAYVIEVQHVDATPGKQGDDAYDSIRCASTLSFRVADGLQGPPQPPVVTPKR
jgi:hypothetical protein